MTTSIQQPYNDLVGDAVNTTFTFTFSIVENVDLLVLVNGVLQVESSAYTVQNLTDDGGDIVFHLAPVAGARVLILRRTTISQNVDYGEFSIFPAETHEWNLDKITYILQELLGGAFGGKDSDGNDIILSFDLSVTATETTLIINNTGGTDAILPVWESGGKAGVFIGEITNTAPVDGNPTSQPEGYVWVEVA